MKKSRFSEEQIVAILQEGEQGQTTVDELCREHGSHKQTYYGWKRKYNGLSSEEI